MDAEVPGAPREERAASAGGNRFHDLLSVFLAVLPLILVGLAFYFYARPEQPDERVVAISASRVGYAPLSDSIVVAANQSIDRALVLSAVAELEAIEVAASPLPRSFEERRALGLGTFFTRAELAKMEDRSTAAIFAQVPGIQMIRSLGPQTYVASTRGREVRRGEPDMGMMAPPACYASVYLDRVAIYSGREGERLFNINSISPDRIEAIEFYPSESLVPIELQSHNTRCGVLVIHTRRSK